MTDVLDPTSIIDAAQEAVAAGDFPTAERLLRDAAAIQEASLGSTHPDLATTLNNLAFVCERTNNIAEAERGYRRAHKIAVASLGPRHPFVATSVKNLVDFCAAHEIPIWTPAAARSDGAATEFDTEAELEADFEAETEPEADTEAEIEAETATEFDAEIVAEASTIPEARHGWSTPQTIAVAALGVVVMTVVLLTMRGREATSPTGSPPSSSTAPVLTRDAQPTVPVDAKTDAAPARVQRSEPRESRPKPPEKAKAVTPQPVTVLNARLCSALEKRGSPDWQCASASGDLKPGTYTFYTRLQTNANTTVEHRWYRDARVHQVMRLRVTANPSGGFRTFSSNTISPERAGDWKVELRDAEGTLLQEEHFVVR
jgi:Protein of unknown function (DUF2914)/Tetratricopeptide repeat